MNNIYDTVTKLENDCELVHEFTKGDKTVVVQGEAGSYPSLAKIAADSQFDLSNLVSETREQLEVSNAALIATSEALTGLFHLASGIIGKSYKFTHALEVPIYHQMGTDVFTVQILGTDGSIINAPATPIDKNNLIINFMDYESGIAVITYFMNT